MAKAFSAKEAAKLAAALNAAYAATKDGSVAPGYIGAGASSGGGGGGWASRLKSIGGGVLDALSVPQAILFTGIQKGAHHTLGTKDVSWKGLGGRFYKGYKGGAGMLNAFGANPNSWATKLGGLGLDIGADPLWFTAPVMIPLKGAKIAEALGDARNFNTAVDSMGVYDKAGNVISSLAGRHADEVFKGPRQAAVRLGTRKHGKDIRLPIRSKGKQAENLKVGSIRMNPTMDVTYRIRRTAREMGERVTAQVAQAAEKFGMSPAQKTTFNIIVHAPSKYQQERMIAAARKNGTWDETSDQAFKWMRGKYDDTSREAGFRGHDEHIKSLAIRLKNATKARTANAALGRSSDPEAQKFWNFLNNEEWRLTEELAQARRKTPYAHQRTSDETVSERLTNWREGLAAGTGSQPLVRSFGRIQGDNPFKGRQFESQFGKMTADDFTELATKGDLDPGFAAELQRIIGKENFAPAPIFDQQGVRLMPDLDAFRGLGDRMAKGYKYQAEQEVRAIMEKHGIPEGSDLAKAIQMGVNAAADPGSLRYHAKGAQRATAFLKGLYTTANIAHFVNNAIGDYLNRLINGNLRHLGTRASVPRSEIWRLANGDPEMLAKQFDIGGGKTKSGEELLSEAHAMGLGHGFQQTDVDDLVKWFSNPKNPFGILARGNAKRENAQRLETWIKHVRGGEDPFSAAQKTLRVHFDYQHMTPFEANWMRNLFLFYTWMKRNSILQVTGVATRPALYNAYGNIENNREKFANEPDYFSKMGALTIPGLGNISFANPMNDLHKMGLSGEGFRKDILGAVTPFARVPMEMAMNKQAFTGGPIEKYEGQKQQHWIGQLLGLGQTTAKEGGKPAGGIDPYLAYIINQLGPMAGTMQAGLSNPDYEGERWKDLIGRISGVKFQQNQPEKFARSAKYREAKKKADATRAANAQRGG